MSVYSTLFHAASSSPVSLTTVYTVPALQTVVVRDIEYQNYSGSPATFTVQGSDSGLSVIILYDFDFPSASSKQWSGRVVLPGGSLLGISGSVASLAYSISGYLLTP